MCILSISTEENKDFDMILLMHNGNVLIAQGIEKILIFLRFAKLKTFKEEEIFHYYNELAKINEVYTICTLDWFIRIFDDGYIDNYINSNNPEIIEEYNL